MNTIMTLVTSCLLTTAFIVPVSAGEPFSGGELDSTTPQVRLLSPLKSIPTGKEITVRVRYSSDYQYCPDCATDPVKEYATIGQIDMQGHIHAYFQEINGNRFPKNRLADSFCPFNFLNQNTKQIRPGVLETKCPALTKSGLYRVCVTAETDAHAQRVKSVPRDFPPVDCQQVGVYQKK
ncbi:MAG: hypothetical protein ACPGYT_02260 [Nitrospirales bacterium]